MDGKKNLILLIIKKVLIFLPLLPYMITLILIFIDLYLLELYTNSFYCIIYKVSKKTKILQQHQTNISNISVKAQNDDFL